MREDFLKKNLFFYQEMIESNTNFSHIKVGDGEIICMKKQGYNYNCDGHILSPELGDKIQKSIIELYQLNNIFFPDWFYSNPPSNNNDIELKIFFEDFLKLNNLNINFIKPFELIMMGWGNMEYNYLLNFYTTIKNSIRNKIYIGPNRLNLIKDILNINSYVEVPLNNAYNCYEEIILKLKNLLIDNSIIMMSVGPMSPVISNELLKINKNITILDIGSGFDTLVVDQTRGPSQATKEQIKKYIEKL